MWVRTRCVLAREPCICTHHTCACTRVHTCVCAPDICLHVSVRTSYNDCTGEFVLACSGCMSVHSNRVLTQERACVHMLQL